MSLVEIRLSKGLPCLFRLVSHLTMFLVEVAATYLFDGGAGVGETALNFLLDGNHEYLSGLRWVSSAGLLVSVTDL